MSAQNRFARNGPGLQSWSDKVLWKRQGGPCAECGVSIGFVPQRGAAREDADMSVSVCEGWYDDRDCVLKTTALVHVYTRPHVAEVEHRCCNCLNARGIWSWSDWLICACRTCKSRRLLRTQNHTPRLAHLPQQPQQHSPRALVEEGTCSPASGTDTKGPLHTAGTGLGGDGRASGNTEEALVAEAAASLSGMSKFESSGYLSDANGSYAWFWHLRSKMRLDTDPLIEPLSRQGKLGSALEPPPPTDPTLARQALTASTPVREPLTVSTLALTASMPAQQQQGGSVCPQWAGDADSHAYPRSDTDSDGHPGTAGRAVLRPLPASRKNKTLRLRSKDRDLSHSFGPNTWKDLGDCFSPNTSAVGAHARIGLGSRAGVRSAEVLSTCLPTHKLQRLQAGSLVGGWAH